MPTFNNMPLFEIETFDLTLVRLKIINGYGMSLFDNTNKMFSKMNFSQQAWSFKIMIMELDTYED